LIIYEAYNKQNGKVYTGLTTKTLEHRRSQHIRSAKSNSNTHFAKAIRKWGEDSFEWSEILRCEDFERLCKLEQMVIQSYENWQTYNISKGGSAPAYGMTHSAYTKRLCGKYAKEGWDGKRAKDKWPEFIFRLSTYREARQYGIPKTTWYRYREVVDLT
jgi:group I intron endonuclease